jgi:hypothetical protein
VKDGTGALVHRDAAPVGAIAVEWDTEATDVVHVGPGVRTAVGREQPPTGRAAPGIGFQVAVGPAAGDPWTAVPSSSGASVAA